MSPSQPLTLRGYCLPATYSLEPLHVLKKLSFMESQEVGASKTKVSNLSAATQLSLLSTHTPCPPEVVIFLVVWWNTWQKATWGGGEEKDLFWWAVHRNTHSPS